MLQKVIESERRVRSWTEYDVMHREMNNTFSVHGHHDHLNQPSWSQPLRNRTGLLGLIRNVTYRLRHVQQTLGPLRFYFCSLSVVTEWNVEMMKSRVYGVSVMCDLGTNRRRASVISDVYRSQGSTSGLIESPWLWKYINRIQVNCRLIIYGNRHSK